MSIVDQKFPNKSSNLQLLLLLLLLVSVFGCNKDEEGYSDEDILGAWNITGATADISVNDMPLVDYLMNSQGLSETDALALEIIMSDNFASGFLGDIEFKADHTFVAKFGTSPEQTGTWELNVKDLKIQNTGESDVTDARILVLNSALMVLRFTEEQTDDINNDQTDEDISVVFELSLQK